MCERRRKKKKKDRVRVLLEGWGSATEGRMGWGWMFRLGHSNSVEGHSPENFVNRRAEQFGVVAVSRRLWD